MFQLLKNPDFDFMRHGRLLLGVSSVLVVVSIAVLALNGLNFGIEFTGGTEVQLKYTEAPRLGEIRSALIDAGLRSPVVTTIGDPEENEVYIRLATQEVPGESNDLTSAITRKLRQGTIQEDRLDVNVADGARLQALIVESPGVESTEATRAAEAISEARKNGRIFKSVAELAEVEGVSTTVVDHLEDVAYAGPISVRSQSYIGPAIGKELLNKAMLAIFGSLVGMLVYIWIRFQWQWGVAAVAALAHDTLLTLGVFSLAGKEMSLPVVAAFLTLIGYSVNDTVVVFDRIRENLTTRSASTFYDTINLSINQTLSRTVITSGLTFIVVFVLYVFGGAALKPFSFVLWVGILVGTYSSIYIASPLLMLWKGSGGQAAGSGESDSGKPIRRTAKKVRTGAGAQV